MTDFLTRYGNEPLDGKYRLVQRLGAGGMGEVFKAEHVFLGASRVIKIIRQQISDNVEAHDRFLREARLATKVHHQNVATLHDFAALPDGSHYMVWEFIDGENVAQLLRRRGPLPPRQAIRLAVEALAGLDAIHRAGIVHRDISPENIMVTQEDGTEHVKIIDLGVAKADEGDQQYTRTGMFVGKLRYASPEHLGFLPEGERLDGRADLYSLAIVIYEMLTGRAPFEATSPHQYYIRYSREEALTPVDLSMLPPELQAVLTRALDRDRNRRYANAREFAEALQHAATTIPDTADMQTMALPAGDATMRLVETPFRTTQRSEYGATDKTLASTPLPAQPPVAQPVPIAQQTIVDGRPMPPRRSSALPIILIIVVLLMLTSVAAVGYLVLWPWWSARQTATMQTTTTATSASVVPPSSTSSAAPSQTSVDVMPPATTSSTATAPTETTITPVQPPSTTTTAPATQTTASTTTSRPRPHVEPQPQPPTQTAEQPAEQTEEESESSTRPAPGQSLKWTYYDGHGDSSGNGAAMSYARSQLSGVRRVAVTGSGDEALRGQLAQLLGARGFTVTDSADTTIKFYGKLERNTLGRKRRYADALVYKNGKLVFHYNLPLEDYRVGDNPAEAFARVIADVFQ